jgi:hypothetical protein
MVRTRRQKRRPGSATRRSYRRRVRGSRCRGAGPAACRGRSGCKYASGRKRSYCRKSGNTRRRRSSRRGGSLSLMQHVRKGLLPYALYHTQKTHQRRKRRRGRRKRRRSRR